MVARDMHSRCKVLKKPTGDIVMIPLTQKAFSGISPALAKKQRRQAAHRARQDALGIEGVITTVTTQLRPVKAHRLDMGKLYQRAVADMGLRIRLTDEARAGRAQSAKRRRELNNWELATSPAGAADAWQEDSKHVAKGTRRAVGKCDVDSVTKLNQAKRGY